MLNGKISVNIQHCIIYYFLRQKIVEIVGLVLYTFMFYEEHLYEHKFQAKYSHRGIKMCS